MTVPPPRRPWYGRKRIWAAASVLLLAAYPVSLGPAEYLFLRGRIGRQTLDRINEPMELYNSYLVWWRHLAHRHEGIDFDETALD